MFIDIPKGMNSIPPRTPCTINPMIHIDSISLHHRRGTLGSVTYTRRNDTFTTTIHIVQNPLCGIASSDGMYPDVVIVVLYCIHSLVVMTEALFTLKRQRQHLTSSAFQTQWQHCVNGNITLTWAQRIGGRHHH